MRTRKKGRVLALLLSVSMIVCAQYPAKAEEEVLILAEEAQAGSAQTELGGEKAGQAFPENETGDISETDGTWTQGTGSAAMETGDGQPAGNAEKKEQQVKADAWTKDSAEEGDIRAEDDAGLGEPAGTENSAGSGITAGQEDSMEPGEPAGTENSAESGKTAGQENSMEPGEPADQEDSAESGKTTGSEVSAESGELAGWEINVSTGESADQEDDAKPGESAGTETGTEPEETSQTQSGTGSEGNSRPESGGPTAAEGDDAGSAEISLTEGGTEPGEGDAGGEDAQADVSGGQAAQISLEEITDVQMNTEEYKSSGKKKDEKNTKSGAEEGQSAYVLTDEVTVAAADASDAAVSRRWMRSQSVFERCYGDQLVGESRRIYDVLKKSWLGGSTKNITYTMTEDFSFEAKGTVEDGVAQWDKNGNTSYLKMASAVGSYVQGAYDAFAYDFPEVFWLSTMHYYCGINFVSVSSGKLKGTITTVEIFGDERYPGAKSEVAAFNRALENEAAGIRSQLPPGADTFDIVKAIHDHICNTVAYDYEEKNCKEYNDTAHTAAGVFLKDRVVVCEGYAKAMKILCQKFGIECVLIVGNAGGPHMWNYVKMDDGMWYLLDATWDDQERTLLPNGTLDYEEVVLDIYFLVGSSAIGSGGQPVSSERIVYTDFSGSGAKSFIMPALSASSYVRQPHDWQEIGRTEATCQRYATVVYACSICGTQKTVLLEESEHIWGDYVPNNDATYLKNGTKTAFCIYGCGEKNTVTDPGTKLTPALKVNVSSIRLQTGQSTTAVKVSGLVRGDKVVSWKSSRPSVAKVGNKGKITAGKTAGKAIITITTQSGLKKKVKVCVQAEEVKTESIGGLEKKVTMSVGGKLHLEPVLSPITSLQEVTYASSDEEVAKVSRKGVITAAGEGKTKITVRSGSAKFTVTVKVTE